MGAAIASPRIGGSHSPRLPATTIARGCARSGAARDTSTGYYPPRQESPRGRRSSGSSPWDQAARRWTQAAARYIHWDIAIPSAPSREDVMNIAISKPKLGKDSKAFLAKKHHMLIGGKWVEAKSGKTFEVEDPATQEVIAHVPAGDKADIDLAVAAARKAFEIGPCSRISPAERSKLVWELGGPLQQHAPEFAGVEALDNGKPVTNARRDDVGGSVAMFRYMAGWSTRLTGETIPVSSPGNWHAYTLRQPVGVVGQIIPWNFPLMMAAWKLAPALAAGCTIVLKPAEQTPLSALRFGELIAEAGIPDGVVNTRSAASRTRSSTTRANAARLARGCSRTSPSTTRSSRAWSTRPARSRAATASIPPSNSGRLSPRSSIRRSRAISSRAARRA